MIDAFYVKLNEILSLFFPTDFTLFERLTLLFLAFGVFVWFFKKL